MNRLPTKLSVLVVGLLGLLIVVAAVASLRPARPLGAEGLDVGTEGLEATTDPTVTDVGPLTTTSPPFPLVETYLALSPVDAGRVQLASAMSTSAEASVVYASRDAGDTWEPVGEEEPRVFDGGDPMLTFDARGRAYFTTIAPDLHVWHSDDGGRSWSAPTVVGEGRAVDRQWIASAPSAEHVGSTVHLAAKTMGEGGRDVIFLSRSDDGGSSFAEPVLMPIDSGYLHTVTDLVVRKDGTILLPYLVNYGRVDRPEEVFRGRRWILISENDGRSWAGPYEVAGNLQFGNRSGDRAMRGLGGGDLTVDDGDGPYAGSAYLTWVTILGAHLQVVLSASRDGGRSWSEPIRVNDAGLDSDHSTPMVAVDAEGVVAVTWNDRRSDPEDGCFEHYVAVSRDGGRSFGPGRRISERPTCPGAGSRWLNGGDTQGLVALPNGGFRTVWTAGNGEDGSLRPWTAVIQVTR